jgi:hypothetical protein
MSPTFTDAEPELAVGGTGGFGGVPLLAGGAVVDVVGRGREVDGIDDVAVGFPEAAIAD